MKVYSTRSRTNLCNLVLVNEILLSRMENTRGIWISINPSQNEFVSIDLYGDGAT